MIAWTSPRTAELLHEPRHLARLASVGRIASEGGGVGCESSAAPLTFSRLRDRLACSFCASHSSPARDLVERA
jgi:hypothetical protein